MCFCEWDLERHRSPSCVNPGWLYNLSVAAVKETPLSSRLDVALPPVLLWYGDTRRHSRMRPMFGLLRSSRRGESLAPVQTNKAGPGVT